MFFYFFHAHDSKLTHSIFDIRNFDYLNILLNHHFFFEHFKGFFLLFPTIS